MSAALETSLRAVGIDPPLAATLARYGAFVLEANRSFNLTGAKTIADLLPHLVDSLSVVPLVKNALVDVGSGAGFPAIPIALATGVPITLIESSRKKAAFLERMLAAFGLAGAVIAERAETAAHRADLRESFDGGTARAVASAPTVAELLLPFIRIGGIAVLQRGTMDQRERAATADAALMLGAEIEEERALEGARRIVTLRKRVPTPLRFPRRAGIPAKRPLCL